MRLWGKEIKYHPVNRLRGMALRFGFGFSCGVVRFSTQLVPGFVLITLE